MAPRLVSNVLFLLLCFRVQAIFDNHAEEFYLGFPPNQNFPQFISKKLLLTTRESTNVTVSITSATGVSDVIVQPGNVTEYTLNFKSSVQSSTDLNKGIHVRAESGKEIAVTAISYHAGTAESFTVFPCHTYPSVSEYVYYVISSETEIGNDMASTLLLVGSSDGTRVTLTPSQTVSIPAQLTDTGIAVDVAQGSSYTFTLNRLQTFLLRHPRDLTGTKVVSNKPMAVISSHECAQVPDTVDFCDFIVEQVPPTLTWGKRHLARSFASRSSNTHYQVIASNDDTALNITCRNDSQYEETEVKLSGGEVYSHEVMPNTTCSFLSSKPVMVVQLSEGGSLEGFGDPLAMLLTPEEQYVSHLSATIPVFKFINGNSKRFLEIYSSVLDISLQMNDQPLPLMEPVYSKSDIVGYVSTVPIPDEASYVTITSNGEVPYSVRYYGFSSLFDGMGHLSATGLDPIAVPWVSIMNTTTVSINESVGSVVLPIMVSGDAESLAEVTVLQCNGSPLPSQYHVEPITVETGNGFDDPVYKEITIYTSEDDVLEKEECLCLQLSPTQNSNVFFNDNYKAQLCFKDNEALTVELVRAVLVQNQVQMTFSASGYTGSVLVPLVLLPEIRYPDLATSDLTLPNFTMYYTFSPQLTEITYSIEVNSEVLWEESPHLVVSLLTMGYNINFDRNSVTLDNLTPVRPDTNSTEMPTTDSPTTSSSIPTFKTVPTEAITEDDSQMTVPIWVLIVCVLSMAIVCAVVGVVVCGCVYFALRSRRKYQVSEESVTMPRRTGCQRSFSEGNLSLQRDEEKTVLSNNSPQHLGLPYRNSLVLSASTRSIPLSNGELSAAFSQDSCRGSYDPLVSKPNSPTHSSTTV